MPERPHLDEPLSLRPLEGEDLLRALLGVDDDDLDPEAAVDEDT